MAGEAAQMLTERTGGSDLAALETTAVRDGDAWKLTGLKWFASNANGSAFVVLAKPEGAADSIRAIAPFLVLWERRDGSRNGVRIRRLKDKLGTKAVASAEVELADAEGFLLAPSGAEGAGGGAGVSGGAGDGRGLARMMEMTNGARLGIAMMGLGCARRALVESLCYAQAREAFGAELVHHPLMQRKLAELIVEVEAAQALVFDGYLGPRLRLGAPLIKLRAARLGITAASDAIEIHGGNGYIEQWPVARILRDAQVNTVWEGPDNILCLDVRRAIERDAAHLPFLDRLHEAVRRGPRATRPRPPPSRRPSAIWSGPSSGGRPSTAPRPRPASTCWRSSWSTCTPPPCSSSRRAGRRPSSGPIARRWSPACSSGATSWTPGRSGASTRRPRSWSASRTSATAPSSTRGPSAWVDDQRGGERFPCTAGPFARRRPGSTGAEKRLEGAVASSKEQAGVAVFAPAPELTVTLERLGERDEMHLHAGGQGFWIARLLSVLGVPTSLQRVVRGRDRRRRARADRAGGHRRRGDRRRR